MECPRDGIYYLLIEHHPYQFDFLEMGYYTYANLFTEYNISIEEYIPPIQFTGIVDDYGIDADNDSYYDYLVIEAQVNVTEEGDYELDGDIYYWNETNGEWNWFGGEGNNTYFTKGIHNITIRFDGLRIYRMRYNGNFKIYLSLYQTSPWMYMDSMEYYTKQYNYSEFGDAIPPTIGDITYPSQIYAGFINITCNASDNVGVAEIWINITLPNGSYINASMKYCNGAYYYNASFDLEGTYSFYLYAKDVNGNGNTSAVMHFQIATKADINKDSHVNVLDLIIIGVHFGGQEGDERYIKEADLNNDGVINVLDMIIVAMHWTG
ncbi:MAG: hypothetical protein J7K47_04980 [Thermoplasmata archaeon]|nr:hypothetical protein [Thermoplasmata archaeon]